LKTVRNIVPHHAAKSTIVRGAHLYVWMSLRRFALCGPLKHATDDVD
jgi:hypothetical protein